MNPVMYQGRNQKDFHVSPRRLDGGGMQCMSLQCEQAGGCAPIAATGGHFIYPPDCATGALVESPGFMAPPGYVPRAQTNPGAQVAPDSPIGATDVSTMGQSPTASTATPFNIGDIFGGMSTTTLLLLGAAAYFLFFRKH